MYRPLVPGEFDSAAAIFDRSDLRTLQASYSRALSRLEVTRIMDAEAKSELAKLVFHLGRERIVEGTGLRYRGVEAGLADEAVHTLDDAGGIALCA